MQIIAPGEALLFLRERAVVIEGMSFILYDTSQFMAVSSIPHSESLHFLTSISIIIIGGENLSLEQCEYTLPYHWYLESKPLCQNPRVSSFPQVTISCISGID